MDAAVLDYGLTPEQSLNQSQSDLVAFNTPSPVYYPLKRASAHLLPLLLAVSVFTGTVKDSDYLSKQLQLEQLSSAREVAPAQQDRRLSLREARQIALRVLAETEKN